jgi:hypothetical protein
MSYLIAVLLLVVLLSVSGAAVLIAIARLVEILPPLGEREDVVAAEAAVRAAARQTIRKSATRQLLR